MSDIAGPSDLYMVLALMQKWRSLLGQILDLSYSVTSLFDPSFRVKRRPRMRILSIELIKILYPIANIILLELEYLY